MSPSKPQRIGVVVPDVLKRVGEQHGALFTIQQRWNQLVGRRLAAHTRPAGLRRGRLVVYAERPGDSFALSYQRTQLLERLQATTRDLVEEIVIRPGDAARGKQERRDVRRSPRQASAA